MTCTLFFERFLVFLSVRFLEEDSLLSYVVSLCHTDCPRCLCCTVDQPSQFHYLVTGGDKLLVWKRKSATTQM